MPWVPPPPTQRHHSCSIMFFCTLDCSHQHSTCSNITHQKQNKPSLWSISPFSYCCQFSVRHSVSTFFPLILFKTHSIQAFDSTIYRTCYCQGHQWPPYYPIQWLFLSYLYSTSHLHLTQLLFSSWNSSSFGFRDTTLLLLILSRLLFLISSTGSSSSSQLLNISCPRLSFFYSSNHPLQGPILSSTKAYGPS